MLEICSHDEKLILIINLLDSLFNYNSLIIILISCDSAMCYIL